MSDYSKSTNFTAKDGLASGDPNKRINGSLFDEEFDPIATAVASKIDKVAGETGELSIFTSSGGLESSNILPSIFDTFALEIIGLMAGDGITGGGDLTLDRTFTLGTPTIVDDTTDNSVTSDSHTHALDISTDYISDKFAVPGMQDIVGNAGYQVFPGGLILQWGLVSLSANTISTQNLTKAYSTTHVAAWAVMNGVNIDYGAPASATTHSLTQIKVCNADGGSRSIRWFSIGV